ncbi:MAG: hypothetical protein RLZZ94_395, partial [Bacteroidota bacterium]
MSVNESIQRLNAIPFDEITKVYQTPCFVYVGEKIEEQYQRLTKAFQKADVKIKYALKANNNISILKILKNQGAGLDAVSLEEVKLGLYTGFKAEEILFTPNSISFSEIVEAVDLGVQINIDNISLLEQFGNKYGSSVPCCVRINPHIVAGGNSHIQTGHIDSKFGISIHQLRHVLRIVEKEKIVVNGLHMHTGSDIL